MHRPFRFSEIEQNVPDAQPGIYEIHTTSGIRLKVGISGNLRKRLVQHRRSRQTALKLKSGGNRSNPQDVQSKQSILTQHLYYDAEIAPEFDLTSESGRRDYLEKYCVIVVDFTNSRADARALEKQREQKGDIRYVGRVLVRRRESHRFD